MFADAGETVSRQGDFVLAEGLRSAHRGWRALFEVPFMQCMDMEWNELRSQATMRLSTVEAQR